MSKPVILCVDDKTVILESLKAKLRKALGSSYAYEFAQDAEEALNIDELNKHHISILLVVSNWLMPGMKGDKFLISVNDKITKIVKILLTGQADKKAIERAYAAAKVDKCLFKPWSPNQSIDIVKYGL
jgi:response regulator RpfG family c-di-GMP phosphodiesterase